MNSYEFYNKTEDLGPTQNVRYFINMKVNPGKAIDLGCGAGKDTVYLIKNGWNVISIDANNTEERIKSNLNDEEFLRFKFQCQKFEELKLSKCNLIVANYSLSFCNSQYFEQMWKEIENNIEKDGYFVGNFYGINDEWNRPNTIMTFLTKEQVLGLFSKFKIVSWVEREEETKTALGENKHLHLFVIVAKKK